MPVCPQCDNRQFSNKEALLQHMKSSSAWHPFCSICDRRFVSETAFDAHMAAKHPPTYDCTVCNRSYHAPFALEDHYRGSPAHPNCGRCGRGFKDAPACEEHHRTAHPKAPCLPCGGRVFYEDALDQHYWDSVNHPSCIPCNGGFKDDIAYAEHVSAAHPELQCGPCRRQFETADAVQAHFMLSPVHPKCNECGLGFEDDDARNAHRESTHNPISLQVPTTEEIKVDDDLLPFNGQECSPSQGDLPMSGTGLDHPIREGRMESPDLRLETNFTSPLKEVKPLFSPTSLPRPGGIIEELWSSRENVQVSVKSPDGKPLTLPSRSPIWTAPSMLYPQQSPTQMVTMNPLRSYASSTNSLNPTESMPRLHNFPPSFSPPTRYYDLPSGRILHSPPTLGTSTGFESSRFTTPLARSMHSPTAPSASTSFDNSRFPTRREGRHFSPPRISPPHSDFHPRLYPGSVRHAARTMAVNRPNYSLGHPTMFEPVNWRKLMEAEGEREARTLEEEQQKESELSTPVVEVPIESAHMPPQFHAHSSATSPSLATASSPTSSALAHSPESGLNDPETRPTTASSNTPSFRGLSYTITPSSECASPQSPSVASPADLELLPAISPLITTPIDFEVPKIDIPEAQQPLPASPVGSVSPVTVVTVLDVKAQDLPVLAISTSSSQSDSTSPREPVDETKLLLKNEDLLTIPPATPSTPVVPSTNINPLHCRVCRADTCDDITASMCGHIFCNRCITDAVIKTSRCPVCMTPTLLYCLFRLDLAA